MGKLMVKKSNLPASVLLSVFLMLYVSPDTLLFGTNVNGNMKLLGYGITFCLTLYWMYRAIYRKEYLGKWTVLFCGSLIALSLLTMILARDFGGNIIKYGYECCIICLALAFCSCVDYRLFRKTYIRVMGFLAAFSVATIVLYLVMNRVVLQFPTFENSTGFLFHFMGFSMEAHPEIGRGHRSFGIFREPGVYIFFLCTAVLLELFSDEEPNVPRLLINAAAVALTFSTAGYIVLVAVVGVYLVLVSERKKKIHLKKPMLILAILACGYVLSNKGLRSTLFGKFFTNNPSKNSRLDSIAINIAMLLESPLLVLTGRGFTYVEENFLRIIEEWKSAATDNTNTLFRILATHGLLYTGGFTYALFRFCRRISAGFFMALAVFFIFVLLLFNENLMLNVIVFVMLIYGIKEKECYA